MKKKRRYPYGCKSRKRLTRASKLPRRYICKADSDENDDRGSVFHPICMDICENATEKRVICDEIRYVQNRIRSIKGAQRYCIEFFLTRGGVSYTKLFACV